MRSALIRFLCVLLAAAVTCHGAVEEEGTLSPDQPFHAESYDGDFDVLVNNGNATSCGISTCSYGELAQARVYSSFSQLALEMMPLVDDPSAIIVNDKPIKNLRKVRRLVHYVVLRFLVQATLNRPMHS